jgi:SOS response regulatory protein OraA/RecX
MTKTNKKIKIRIMMILLVINIFLFANLVTAETQEGCTLQDPCPGESTEGPPIGEDEGGVIIDTSLGCGDERWYYIPLDRNMQCDLEAAFSANDVSVEDDNDPCLDFTDNTTCLANTTSVIVPVSCIWIGSPFNLCVGLGSCGTFTNQTDCEAYTANITLPNIPVCNWNESVTPNCTVNIFPCNHELGRFNPACRNFTLKINGAEIDQTADCNPTLNAGIGQNDSKNCRNQFLQTTTGSDERLLIGAYRPNDGYCSNYVNGTFQLMYAKSCTTDTNGYEDDDQTGGDFWYNTTFGAYNYNQLYDFNNDTVINITDYNNLVSRNNSWDGSFWTPIIDFNAQFGVYEKLSDYTLGFLAYMGKIVNGAMPKEWFISVDGDGRCSPEEAETLTAYSLNDCRYCNNDGFCSMQESKYGYSYYLLYGHYCSDCEGTFPVEPIYSEFWNSPNNLTTNFSLVPELTNVTNSTFENIFGMIRFLQGIDYTKKDENEKYIRLDVNESLNISNRTLTLNTINAPQLNKLAEITFYNLTECHPEILKNDLTCSSGTCKLIDYRNVKPLAVQQINNAQIITNTSGMSFTLEFNATNYTYGIKTQSTYNYVGSGYRSPIKVTLKSGSVTRDLKINLTYDVSSSRNIYLPKSMSGTVYVAEDGSTYSDKNLKTIAKAATDPYMEDDVTTASGPSGVYEYKIYSIREQGGIDYLGRINENGTFEDGNWTSNNQSIFIRYHASYPATIRINGKEIYMPASQIEYRADVAEDGSTYAQPNYNGASLVYLLRKAPVPLTNYTKPNAPIMFNVTGFTAGGTTKYSIKETVPNVSYFNGNTTNFCYVNNISSVKDAVIENSSIGKIVIINSTDFSELNLNNDMLMGGNSTVKWISITGTISTSRFTGKEAIITFYDMNLVNPIIIGNFTDFTLLRYFVPTGDTKADYVFKAKLKAFSPIWIAIVENDTPTEFIQTIQNITLRNGTQEVRINVSDYFRDNDTVPQNLTYDEYGSTGNISVQFYYFTDYVQAVIRPLIRFFTPFSFFVTAYEQGVIDGAIAQSNQIFGFILPDRPPVQTQTILDIVMNEDDFKEINLSQYFMDPDGQFLYYSWNPILNGANVTISKRGVAQNIWWNISTVNYSETNSMPASNLIQLVPRNISNFNISLSYATYYYNSYITSSYIIETDLLRINFWNQIGNTLHLINGTINITYDNGKTLAIYIPDIIYTNRNNMSLFVSKDGSTYYDETLTQLARASPSPIVDPYLTIIPDANWHGRKTIKFEANDTIYKTSSNNVDIIVHAVNDAPTKVKDIEDIIMWENDTEPIINLTPDYFYDIDIYTADQYTPNDSLTFNYTRQDGTPAQNINITFTPAIDKNNRANATVRPINQYWNGYEDITLNVYDSSQLYASTNFTVYVMDKTNILTWQGNENITWAEDTTKTLNLSYMFGDSEGDATYAYYNLNTSNITVELNIDSGDVTLRADADWFGIATINFTAKDSTTEISKIFKLNVTPVNDAPRLRSNITVDPWPRDESRIVDLSQYFYEAYNENTLLLNFSDRDKIPTMTVTYVEGNNTNYTKELSNMTPAPGWYGSGWIRFCATDNGNLTTCSNLIPINITSNKAPQLNGTIPNLFWDEDKIKYLNLEKYFIDEEGTALNFTPVFLGPDKTNITIRAEMVNNNTPLQLSWINQAGFLEGLGGGLSFITTDNTANLLTAVWGANGTSGNTIYSLNPTTTENKPIKIYKTTLTDPSFEIPNTYPDNWNISGGTNAQVTTSYDKFEGDKSLRVERNSGNGEIKIQTSKSVPVTKNTQYLVSAYIKTENIRNINETISVRIICNQEQPTEINITNATTQKQGTSDWEDWTLIQRVYNTEENTECSPLIYFSQDAQGIVWIDLANFDKYYETSANENYATLKASIEAASGQEIQIFLPKLNNSLRALYVGIDGSTYYNETNGTLFNLARRSPNVALIPDANWYGNRTVAFIATDGQYNKTTNNIKLEVISVNDIPIFKGPIQNIPMNESDTRIVILNNYFDDVEDGTNLTYNVTRNTQNGNITINITGTGYERNATIKTAPYWNGYGEVKFTATDSYGNYTDSNIFIVYVGEYNDPISITNNTNLTIRLQEDNETRWMNLSEYFIDRDNDAVYWSEANNTKFDVMIATPTFKIKPKTDYCNYLNYTYINASNENATQFNQTNDTIILFAQDAISEVNRTFKIIVNCTPDKPFTNITQNITFKEDESKQYNDTFRDPDLIWLYDFFASPLTTNQTTPDILIQILGQNNILFQAVQNWFGFKPILVTFTDFFGKQTNATINVNVTPEEDNATFTKMDVLITGGNNATINVITNSSDADPEDNVTLEVYNSSTTLDNTTRLCNATKKANASCSFNQTRDNSTHTIYGYVKDTKGNNATNNPLNVTYEFNAPNATDNRSDSRFWFNNINGTIQINATDPSGINNIKYCIVDYYENNCTPNIAVNVTGNFNSTIINITCNNIMCIKAIRYNAQDIFGNIANTTYRRINIIYGSQLFNTTVNKTSTVLNSTINNSDIINSTVINCTYNKVTIRDSNDTGSVTTGNVNIDPSTLQNNTYIGAVNIVDSKIKHSTIKNSNITTSSGCYMNITNATITDGKILNGTVIWNGTVYNSSSGFNITDSNINCIFDDFETTPITPPSGGGGGGGGGGKVCNPVWECTDWTECNKFSGTKTRICKDTKNCGKLWDKPVETETCRFATCDDGIQNQDETGIDCGGSCKSCPTPVPTRPIIEKPTIPPVQEQPAPAVTEEEKGISLMAILLAVFLAIMIIGIVAISDLRRGEPLIPIIGRKEEEEEKPADDYLERAVMSVIGHGFTIEDVKQALMKKGWNEDVAEHAIREAVIKKYKLHEPHGELEKLEKSIDSIIGHGYMCQDVRKSLVDKGWPRDVVDEALHESVIKKHELHQVHDNKEKLIESIKSVRCHGFTKEIIAKKLIEKGWDKKIVDEAMKQVK